MTETPRGNRADERDCPECGASLTDERPNHCVILEIEDRTRSTKQFMGDETNIKRLYLDRELCEQCWGAYYDRFTRGRS